MPCNGNMFHDIFNIINILCLEAFMYKCDICLASLLIFKVHSDEKLWINFNFKCFYFLQCTFIKKLCIFFPCILNIYFQKHRWMYCCLSGFCVCVLWRRELSENKVQVVIKALPEMEVDHMFISALSHFEMASNKSYWIMNDKNVLKNGKHNKVIWWIFKMLATGSLYWS